jgi:hypothetical protein
MHRPTLSLLLAALLALLVAAPARADFFLGDAIDAPSPDARTLGDLDLARDGTGAVVYTRAVGGIDHVFAARFDGGRFQALAQIDTGLPGPSSQPVVGASDGGRLAITFVSAGVVYGVVRPSGGEFATPVAFGAGGAPSVDLSINGTAFASFTSDAGDVRIARLDRRTNAWGVLGAPADVDPARPAGVGTDRSKVAISADGIGVVTWGEAGHVFARKMFNGGLSNAPQDLTPATFDGRVSAASDEPDVDAEDDSSYAWVVFRQSFADGASRILARRQRGTAFDPPVAVDAGDEAATDPRIDLNGRGLGLATMAGMTSNQPMLDLVDLHDVFGVGGRIFSPSLAAPATAPTISENNSALVAAILSGAGDPAVVVVPIDDGKGGSSGTLSRPESGPVDAAAGLDAASDRAGGVLVAWVQGGAEDRRIVVGSYDRPPGAFLGYTGQACCRTVTPALKWQQAFNLWGAVTYEVSVDGVVVAQTTADTLQLVKPLTNGTHKWQVKATDIRGQVTRSKTRLLRIDARKPLLSVGYKRKKRVVTISARPRDDARLASAASGIASVRISWGDNTPATAAKSTIRVTHRYRRKGTYKLTVTARDKVGNETAVKRTIRIGK